MASTLLALAAGEWLFQWCFPAPRNPLLHALTAESRYFHRFRHTARGEEAVRSFDPRLGWKPRKGWPPREPKRGVRIALTGDSFAYGYRLEEAETLARQLERFLGPGHEVVNLAYRGYGFDQMALVAAELAPEYEPDWTVVATIGEDFRRSCLPFLYGHRKPYFTEAMALRTDHLVDPAENWRRHDEPLRRLGDALIHWAGHSGILIRATELAAGGSFRECTRERNVGIVGWLGERVGSERLRMVHLQGWMPGKVKRAIRRAGIPLLSLPEVRGDYEKRHGPRTGTVDGWHPDGAQVELYARAIADFLKGRPESRPPGNG